MAPSALPLPPTPRGRSRFSKALPPFPTPPLPPPSSDREPRSPAASVSTSKSIHSPLPFLPKMSIPRRPVGAQNAEPEPPRGSVASLSSIYSDSPDLQDVVESDMQADSRDRLNSYSDTPPPPPPKKERTSPITPDKALGSPFQQSPPRQEIWRRRSVRSDKSISLPDIKIKKSNGSTASPPRPPPERALPGLPKSLSGRKPVPARPAPPQPPTDDMGSKLSKLKKKLSKEDYDPYRKDEAYSQQQTYPTGSKRLPTPEYQNTDREQPHTPQVLSPHSPNPPETPPQDEATPPAVPHKSASRNTIGQTLNPSSSTPNLLLSHSRQSSETLTVTSEPEIRRSPQPQKTYAASQILTPEPASPELASPFSLTTPVGARAIEIKFPGMPGGPLPQHTIVAGPPLEPAHFECYQAHRFMRNSRNHVCPVACMICEKKDAEARWKCNWCCLRCCGNCMQALTSVPGKDLKLCLEKVSRQGTMA
ncbi:hypothetical protein BP5796_04748 [Coleophoma crateriformis]|uniref:Uncharacterized protein n=1 Tax=Coleophoma crateriformis TaxID=565419 RepID=A0A3D8SA77_9HELO|nr:hypothetical protein BP5796_04748 [Coleophoma crateriformis]